MGRGTPTLRSLEVFESVRCLDCSAVYAKPVSGGTAAANPGCPECGYLGWLGLSGDGGAQPLHCGADPPPHRSA